MQTNVNELTIRPARLSDAEAAVNLVLRSFDEFIAPDYPPEGVDHFHAHVTVDGLIDSITNREIVFVAVVDERLAGVVQVRDDTHITWLYVDKSRHRSGIGRELVVSAAREIRRRTAEADAITLNSSPYALEIYRRMGFVADGPETVRDGMRFTAMRADIGKFAD